MKESVAKEIRSRLMNHFHPTAAVLACQFVDDSERFPGRKFHKEVKFDGSHVFGIEGRRFRVKVEVEEIEQG